MLILRNGKKLTINEWAGMVKLTLLNENGKVENSINVSADYIAGMVFDINKKEKRI